ncbi:unnamed protein product [Cyprideis torosa]|uniref:Uncharacterized protein n=1 Tax=Cyprideis torosa TaxID=163714 RepID=A0A7R8ZLF7_9CRUS|nr:unnamed protein product [Cyprideis torosa]CAG0886618.1 unnamed protein product [Cyprideis torosa]
MRCGAIAWASSGQRAWFIAIAEYSEFWGGYSMRTEIDMEEDGFLLFLEAQFDRDHRGFGHTAENPAFRKEHHSEFQQTIYAPKHHQATTGNNSDSNYSSIYRYAA